jgi:hypothetical protein
MQRGPVPIWGSAVVIAQSGTMWLANGPTMSLLVTELRPTEVHGELNAELVPSNLPPSTGPLFLHITF